MSGDEVLGGRHRWARVATASVVTVAAESESLKAQMFSASETDWATSSSPQGCVNVPNSLKPPPHHASPPWQQMSSIPTPQRTRNPSAGNPLRFPPPAYTPDSIQSHQHSLPSSLPRPLVPSIPKSQGIGLGFRSHQPTTFLLKRPY